MQRIDSSAQTAPVDKSNARSAMLSLITWVKLVKKMNSLKTPKNVDTVMMFSKKATLVI